MPSVQRNDFTMRIDEFIKLQNEQPKKRARSKEEHNIQASCVQWFRMEFPEYEKLLFAIPNGGSRSAREGKSLKDEGVLAGVADLFLAVPNSKYHGCFIEMKTTKGRQQGNQKEFEFAVTAQRYDYQVCRSLSEFMGMVIGYLSNNNYEQK